MKKKKILCVDDDAAFLKLLRRQLESHDFDVSVAQDAKSFHGVALVEKPDLIVLDIILGNDMGPTTYDQLLELGFDKKVPVIFLSGLASDQPKNPASEGGTYALHSKPFDIKKLLEDINRLIGK